MSGGRQELLNRFEDFVDTVNNTILSHVFNQSMIIISIYWTSLLRIITQ